MSVTSSPEPMELDPTPAPSLLPSDLSVDWPIEEDQDLIFSLRVNVPEREPTRTKVLGLATQEHLTVGENIRQLPSYSEEEGIFITKSIKSHQIPSSHRCNTKNLSLFAQSTPPQPSDYSTHKNTDPLSPTTQPSHDLPKAAIVEQNRTNLSHSNDAGLHCHPEHKTPAVELNNVTGRLSQEVSDDSVRNDIDNNKTALNCGACETDKRISSPVFVNGSQDLSNPPFNPNTLSSQQNERFIGTQSLDTPPLSSSTPEESTSEPFHDSTSFHEGNGSSVLQSQENETAVQESKSQAVTQDEEDRLSKQPLREVSQEEIENTNPNYDLETPPDDIPLPEPIASAPEDSGEEQALPKGDATCPNPEVVETPECDLHVDSPTAEGVSSNLSVVDSENFEEEIVSNELLTPTRIAEVETFCTSRPDNPTVKENPPEDDDSLSISLPPVLKECIYHPPLDLKTKLYMDKCEDIVDIQQVLQEKSRELQAVIGLMEKKLLIQQSSTFLTVACDKNQLPSEPSDAHSHLLKQTRNRELEKQARFYRATLKKDSMQTGYETASSSDDECYMNSTNLGGPKRRRLTKLHRDWLADRVEIGVRWNWLDLQISQIEAELSSVNQRLEELNSSRVSDQEQVPTETSSRCIPYSRALSSSRVIHNTIPLRADSMTNILQSSPHYHSILSLRDNIPCTLLLHDSLMSIQTKDLPFDSKDLKKLEQTISHNKSTTQFPIRRTVNSIQAVKIGHRPKLNSRSSSFMPRFGSVSVAEMSRHKAGKNKPLLSGGLRHRRARSYDTTSIIIPGSSLPRQEKPSFKEIVIPGWREFSPQDPSSVDDYDSEDCTELTYVTLHSKQEQAEKQNYVDAMHLSTASSKKLKRLLISPDSPKVYSASYGWDFRLFPLSSDENDLEEVTARQNSKTTESSSPIEDSVFSTPHITSHSTNAQ